MNSNSDHFAGCIEVSDDMIADLARYLNENDGPEKNAKSLHKTIDETLSQLELRLEQQSREMKPSEEYRQLSAARQAVQAAALAMQLYHAGHKDDSH